MNRHRRSAYASPGLVSRLPCVKCVKRAAAGIRALTDPRARRPGGAMVRCADRRRVWGDSGRITHGMRACGFRRWCVDGRVRGARRRGRGGVWSLTAGIRHPIGRRLAERTMPRRPYSERGPQPSASRPRRRGGAMVRCADRRRVFGNSGPSHKGWAVTRSPAGPLHAPYATPLPAPLHCSRTARQRPRLTATAAWRRWWTSTARPPAFPVRPISGKLPVASYPKFGQHP
jgi:hypothetical protein